MADCASFVDPPNQVRIGSQADAAFLRSVVNEIGRLDVVLDDGSHIASHQRASFRALFPLLSDGGLYIIEDTHTSYWPHMEGGFRRRGSAIEFAKTIVDDMHGWYHNRQGEVVQKDQVASVSFYDSIVVIEKRAHPHPVHIKMGTASRPTAP
jgi:hypothetical protein